VSPLRIVEHLDIVEDIPPCFSTGAIRFASNSFPLEQLEEALGNGVIVAVTALILCCRLCASGCFDLVSRFALRQLKFRGLQTEEDFASLLGLIDRQCYPTTSTCAWPQFFAPRLWGAGFRMKSETGRLITAIASQVPEGLVNGVPARQLFLAIRRFLIDLSDIDGTLAEMPTDLWEAAIDYALVEEATLIACNGAPPRSRRKGGKL
jgi:hypothetical protein